MVAGWTERIMGKTDDTLSNIMPLNPERELATEITDSELDTVSAGVSLSHGIIKWTNELLSFRRVSKAS
jgi:hypothetical protein